MKFPRRAFLTVFIALSVATWWQTVPAEYAFAPPASQVLLASDRADGFASSLAVDGDTAVVGAYGADTPAGENAGQVFVYTRTNGVWARQAILTATDAATNDFFGFCVVVEGDTLIVGTPYADTGAGVDAGAAYVFTRAGTTWTQRVKLTAGDGAANDHFGSALALQTGTLIVSAPQDDIATASNAGSAYAFTGSGAAWNQQAKLTALDGATSDHFGDAVALDGDRAAIGAPLDDLGGPGNEGSTYVFKRDGAAWTQEAKLTADAGGPLSLGVSIAISGTTVTAGAIHADGTFADQAGAVFVFALKDGLWQMEVKVVAPDGRRFDQFGDALALQGDVLIVGEPGRLGADGRLGAVSTYQRAAGQWTFTGRLEPEVSRAGRTLSLDGNTLLLGTHDRALLYVRAGAAWTREGMLAPGANSNDRLGSAVDVHGDRFVVGAPFDDVGTTVDAGSASLYTAYSDLPVNQLKASDAGAGDRFGSAVSIGYGWTAVGAPLDDTGGGVDAGSVYVFRIGSLEFPEETKFTAADAAAGDRFGASVKVEGNMLIVGAPGDDNAAGMDAGAVYVFRRDEGWPDDTWTQEAKLTAADASPGAQFGASVGLTLSFSGDKVAVGAPGDDAGAKTDAGSAYVFTRSGTTWSQQAKATPTDGQAFDAFGASVAVDGTTLVAGAPNADVPSRVNTGAAYVFTRQGLAWPQEAKLFAIEGGTADQFGISVATQGDYVVVGALALNGLGGDNSGSAHLFERDRVLWQRRHILVPSGGAPQDLFGSAVSVGQGMVIVGAPGRDDPMFGSNVGSAYSWFGTDLNPGICLFPLAPTCIG